MRPYLFVILCFVFLGICSCEDDLNQTKLQYMPDMADGPVAKYHRSYLDPPEFSVSYMAMIYPKTIEEAEKFLVNPLATGFASDEHLKRGESLYQSFCIHCHGLTGLGDGPVTKKFPRPPSLMSEESTNRGDGYYFHRITFGSELMPPQGHALDPRERWQIVMYLRELQEAGHGK